jgi:hypothetical protein
VDACCNGTCCIADWIAAHVNTFTTIGSGPKAVVYDNLRAGVTKPSLRARHQSHLPGLGGALRLCGAAGAGAQAARQGQSGSAMQIVQRFVLARLRNRRFFSLVELNAAIRECMIAPSTPP